MGELRIAIVPVTPFQQNCAILWDSESMRGAVVDPGGNVARIREALTKTGVTAEKILLTHGHIDHAGAAAELAEALKLPIEGPDARDSFLLQGLAEQGRAYGMPEARAVQPDRWLAEGDTITIADHVFDVLHCPGHTPGHVVFVNPGARFAVVGDVLFRGSVGRTDFPYGDHAALMYAIRQKLLPLGDDMAFICGHGTNSTFGEERQANPFLRAGDV